MREGILSAQVLFARATPEREAARPEERRACPAGRWNPEYFAREQIRALVRRVFFSSPERPVRQVVFSALEAETDVRSICRRVGEELALETEGSVAVVGEFSEDSHDLETSEAEMANHSARCGRTTLRRTGSGQRGNLWLVPGLVPAIGKDGDGSSAAFLHSHLQEIRTEFEYSIVEASAAGESNQATVMAQFADGIILVLSARRTRKITARKIKDSLESAQARVLGTVLSDRDFPIPERIYRRL
jgi:hypothetical protein